jgi:hypothetical protein
MPRHPLRSIAASAGKWAVRGAQRARVDDFPALASGERMARPFRPRTCVSLSARLLLVLELAVGAGEKERLVPVVEPHEVRGTAVFTADLENLAVAVGLADLLAVDDEALTDSSLHRVPFRSFQRTPGVFGAEGP